VGPPREVVSAADLFSFPALNDASEKCAGQSVERVVGPKVDTRRQPHKRREHCASGRAPFVALLPGELSPG
jgi:hypothetical protein